MQTHSTSKRALRLSPLLLLLLCSSVTVILYRNLQGVPRAPFQLSRILSGRERSVPVTTDSDASLPPTTNSSSTTTTTFSSTCSPRRNVFFLKTHKCASSTIQNILLRYGVHHNLSIAVPKRRYSNLAGFPDHCHSRYVQPNKEMKFNIFCHHCRFHGGNIRQLMAKGVDDDHNETLVVVGVVRNPVDVFQSNIRYFSSANRSAVSYIDDVSRNATKRSFYSRNPMLFDFGVDGSENRTELRRRVRERVAEFDLILVSDYFEESVILMKELLCWTMDDVVYVVHNRLMEGTRPVLSSSEMDVLREWNYGDGLLYSMVNRTFWQRVHRFGHERMQAEVAHLRALRRQWESTCVLNRTSKDNIRDPRMKVAHSKVFGYVLQPDKLTDKSCLYLLMPEYQFSLLVYFRQVLLFP